MLVLSRKKNESIIINDDIEATAAHFGHQIFSVGPVSGDMFDTAPESRTLVATTKHGDLMASVKEQLDDDFSEIRCAANH